MNPSADSHTYNPERGLEVQSWRQVPLAKDLRDIYIHDHPPWTDIHLLYNQHSLMIQLSSDD